MVAESEELISAPNFWNDRQKAKKVIDKYNFAKKIVSKWDSIHLRYTDLQDFLELAMEESDKTVLEDIKDEISVLEAEIEEWEFQSMFGDPDDEKSALLSIHPGAGGTESQDWAEMLMRMYLRWIEKRGFKSEIIDLLPGEEAGIKSVTIEVEGEYAFGYLKSEIGIHRLVRLSPFDANHKRHTSFASVFVYPEVDDIPEIIINDDDLRIDTYRASGAGGQHVNKVSSAVRITHLPSNIVVQCQSERSQYFNKANAMKMLKAKLYQKYKEERSKKLQEIEDKKKDISWGNQIRSYVFHPYNMVKDHRTNEETSNTSAVMDGDIDRFIIAYLKNN